MGGDRVNAALHDFRDANRGRPLDAPCGVVGAFAELRWNARVRLRAHEIGLAENAHHAALVVDDGYGAESLFGEKRCGVFERRALVYRDGSAVIMSDARSARRMMGRPFSSTIFIPTWRVCATYDALNHPPSAQNSQQDTEWQGVSPLLMRIIVLCKISTSALGLVLKI